ncbi:interferon-related developmental regulator family protein / IFRD protein family [Euphorbia peplus]|nr:interferon-related developmental regulator family protein / IFRD protein family [Euphorbia peplus]
MGKRSSQRKNIAFFDTDEDDNSSVSSSSTVKSDRNSPYDKWGIVVPVKDVKDNLLENALDALFEKRGATREKALEAIIDSFNSQLQHEFVEKKFATLLHQCIACIKKGSSKEIALASHLIGLLAVTVGCGDNAREILEESTTPISLALKSGAEPTKTTALLECLAIITFVGGNEPAETERSMQIMWQLVRPKMGSNVVAIKASTTVITAMVSAWAFLLTSMDGWAIDPKEWQESITYFSGLLEKDDRSLRIAVGEALALIFEMGNLEKFAAETKGSVEVSAEGNKSFMHIQGLKSKILNQVRDLASEAGGKGSNKKDLSSQRNLFKDVLDFFEYDCCPEASTKIGGDSLQTSTWSQLIQLNFLKHFLGGGFVKHMQDNDFLHDVFDFTPKKKGPQGVEQQISSNEKRMFRSPNSVMNKARTQFLNKQRMLSKDRNVGHFVNDGEE